MIRLFTVVEIELFLAAYYTVLCMQNLNKLYPYIEGGPPGRHNAAALVFGTPFDVCTLNGTISTIVSLLLCRQTYCLPNLETIYKHKLAFRVYVKKSRGYSVKYDNHTMPQKCFDTY